MRKWYALQAATGDKPAVISIFDVIGMWGVSAVDFIRDLRSVEGDQIVLEINSPGGSVIDGLAMFSAIRGAVDAGKTVDVRVMGIAASMASYLAMAGSTISMPANTFMMVHNPISAVYGNADEMREQADILDKVGQTLASTYMKRSGKPEDEVKALLAAESYLTAAECLELGFCDEVTDELVVTAAFEVDKLPENIQALFKPKAEANVDDPDAAAAAAAAAAAEAAASAAAEAAAKANVPPVADQIKALAEAAGMTEHVEVFAVAHGTVEAATAAIATAKEIKALYAVAKRPDAEVAALIKAGKTIVEARAALVEARAGEDEASHTSTVRSNSEQPTQNAGPSAVTTAGIWAAHRKQISQQGV